MTTGYTYHEGKIIWQKKITQMEHDTNAPFWVVFSVADNDIDNGFYGDRKN